MLVIIFLTIVNYIQDLFALLPPLRLPASLAKARSPAPMKPEQSTPYLFRPFTIEELQPTDGRSLHRSARHQAHASSLS